MSNYYSQAAFRFAIGFSGDSAETIGGSFSEVSGLDAERQVAELEEGGENRFVHRLPGSIKHGNLVLKRGQLTATSGLFAWCKQTLEGGLAQRIQPRDISISLLSPDGAKEMSWVASRAWPVKWSTGGFDSSGETVTFESLEFAFHTLTRKVHGSLP